MNYFTSDIHFSDKKTMEHDKRPFSSIDEYDKYIIKLWNKTMTKGDTLYVVGDLFDFDEEKSNVWVKSLGYFKKIKARVILIVGNNEERIIKYVFNGDFDAFRNVCLDNGIKDVMLNRSMSFGGKDFYLTHKPINYKKGYENLVGHLHKSRGQWFSFGINVSCDLNYFKPLSEDDILFILSERDIYYFSDENFKVI